MTGDLLASITPEHPSLNAVNILQSMRVLLKFPDSWTKGELSRDLEGSVVDPRIGYCWCTLGAMRKASHNLESVAYHAKDGYHYLMKANEDASLLLHHALVQKGFGGTLVDFNDLPTTKHSDVLDLIDAAINLQNQNAKVP